MRYLFISIVFNCLLHQAVMGQVVDAAPSGNQNILAVEGGGIVMKIDSITPLNELIERLNGKWRLHETGKGYWIGYTADMYSIASRGDKAIPALTDFIKTTKNNHGKYGAIYTLHLIGIDRQIAGRFYEEFKNPAARAALLDLLPQSDFTYSIMELLMRDPWKSDIPYLFDLLQQETDEEVCWPIINSLDRYKIPSLPITSVLPRSIQDLRIRLQVENENILESSFDFSGQIKEALKEFKTLYPGKIKVEDSLFKQDLSKYYKTKLSSNLSIPDFLSGLKIDRDDPFGYCDIGCELQYYVEHGRLYFCTISTARQRLLKWWGSLSADERNKFSK